MGFEDQFNRYSWDEDLSSNDNCTDYFEQHILSKLDRPLCLGLDDIDCLFDHSTVAKNFLRLLRSWFEKGKHIPAWQNLRLVLSYSSEDYSRLISNPNQSPFNVGEQVELPELSTEQVQD